ncbi:MAG TPA: hypothetical protein VGO40_10325 [Longimicrobium sp.]|jgi:hypothetical protein|nr:hypothetical protein [Longimicrobium sp.]
MLIDEWMPVWDVVERHETRIRAPREIVWRTVRTLDFARSPIISALFALRSLPGLLSRGPRKKALGTTMDGLLRNGFVLLGERPGEELLLGVVGRFWRPSGDIVRLTADELRVFDRPGHAIGAWDFTLAVDVDAIRLATETRVRCTDEASRRSFRRYWTVVGPFSALIRREMLRSIRRAAESAPPPPTRQPHA